MASLIMRWSLLKAWAIKLLQAQSYLFSYILRAFTPAYCEYPAPHTLPPKLHPRILMVALPERMFPPHSRVRSYHTNNVTVHDYLIFIVATDSTFIAFFPLLRVTPEATSHSKIFQAARL